MERKDVENLLKNCISDEKIEAVDELTLVVYCKNHAKKIAEIVQIDVFPFIKNVYSPEIEVSMEAKKILYGIVASVRDLIRHTIYIMNN